MNIEAFQGAIEALALGRPISPTVFNDARDSASNWTIPDPKATVLDEPKTFADFSNRLVVLLAGLVVELQREITGLNQTLSVLQRLKKYYPDQLGALMKAAGCRDVLEDAKELLNDRNRTSAKKAYDIRRKRLPMEAGLIEWEFGGGMQKQLGTSPFAQGIVFECTCLDDLFAGKLVNMARLEELFNVDRHRLSKAKKSSKTERENRLYDYSSVAAIMDSLLSEAPPKPGQPRRGRPFRLPWLHDPGDPGLRQRVLIRIRERLDTVSAADHIKNAFADVISKHLPDSGK